MRLVGSFRRVKIWGAMALAGLGSDEESSVGNLQRQSA